MCKTKRKVRREKRKLLQAGAFCTLHRDWLSKKPSISLAISDRRNWASMDEVVHNQWSKADLMERGCTCAFPLANSSWFMNRTMTVMSSWKCRRTFLSILMRSEYRISRFRAASWSAAFMSLFALPWTKRVCQSWYRKINPSSFNYLPTAEKSKSPLQLCRVSQLRLVW